MHQTLSVLLNDLIDVKSFASTGHKALEFVGFEVPFFVHIQYLKSSQNLVLSASLATYCFYRAQTEGL